MHADTYPGQAAVLLQERQHTYGTGIPPVLSRRRHSGGGEGREQPVQIAGPDPGEGRCSVRLQAGFRQCGGDGQKENASSVHGNVPVKRPVISSARMAMSRDFVRSASASRDVFFQAVLLRPSSEAPICIQPAKRGCGPLPCRTR